MIIPPTSHARSALSFIGIARSMSSRTRSGGIRPNADVAKMQRRMRVVGRHAGSR
jgi:hypothetical protein